MTRIETFLNLLRDNHIEYWLDAYCRSVNVYPKGYEAFLQVANDPLGHEFLSYGEIYDEWIHIHFSSFIQADFPEAYDKGINLPIWMWMGRRAYKSGGYFGIELWPGNHELTISITPHRVDPYFIFPTERDEEIAAYTDLLGRSPDKQDVSQKKGLIFRIDLTWVCTNEEWADVSRDPSCLYYEQVDWEAELVSMVY